MDMDMDVAWCLTCSKRTNDQRNPYCSDQCRAKDVHASPDSARSISITSTVPPNLLEAEQSLLKRRTSSFAQHSTTPRSRSPIKVVRTPSRPPISPLVNAAPASASGGKTLDGRPRDRRAFSFPALQAPPPKPISISKRRESQLSSGGNPIALPFARKAMGVSLTSSPTKKSPMKNGPTGTLKAPQRRDLLRASKSTGGANTPLDPESVFCSTSESEDEAELPTTSLLKLDSMLNSNATVPTSVALSRKTSKSHSSQFAHTSPPMIRPEFYGRKGTQSPVAQLVASSASSRSREDIISWAKAVGLREETSDEGEESRGRSRTRRAEALPSFTPLDEPTQSPEDHAGTTPKGGIGHALAGLGIGGIRVGPIVKALTSTISPSNTLGSRDRSHGLYTSRPSTYVSSVDVVATSGGVTIPNHNGDESDVTPYHFGGATPTLSTASFSELVDPSVNGTFDHAEVATDDNRSTTSFPRRLTPPHIKQPPPTPQPTRPATTTNAFWNLSSYIRSFAPFSISSVISPYAPFAKEGSKNPSGVVTPAPIPEEPEEETVRQATPLPAARYEDPSETVQPQEMVKSLPLQIAVPVSESGREEQRAKVAEREAREYHPKGGSRGRRSRSRSRGRNMSRATRSQTRSPSRSDGSERGRGRDHVRKVSYDADASDDEEDERRGRSRRGKVLVSDLQERRPSEVHGMPPAVRRLSEGAMRVLGERSASRGDASCR